MCTSAIAQKRNCAAAEIAIVKLCKDEIVRGSGVKIASVKIGNVQARQIVQRAFVKIACV